MISYCNYHKHSMYTNVRISDSTTQLEEYAKRAVELGHKILSSCEHGWQGSQWDTISLARKYNLKPVIAAEAYWVKDRYEQDRTNCHIVIVAKTENGRQALNDVLSEANITGFYGQPRLDIPLILSLPAEDVIVTTACVAYHRYEDVDEITLKFYEHFKDNFYLEVQAHNTESQIKLNKHLLELHYKYGIKLIAGCDSHYIYPDDAQTRTDFLNSKGISYPDEEGWYLDYPDGDTLYKRFATQCVLNHNEIMEAINNTNVFLTVEDYKESIFDTTIKMPTLYPDWTQEQRDEEYKRLVYDGWEKYKQTVPQEQWEHYEQEIAKEVQTVIDTKMADYFIDNYYIVKKGKENGGWLTKTGRGCFTKDALVQTTETLKSISEVKKGDYVFDMYGAPQKVLNTFKYHIKEPMIKITHSFSAGKAFPLICTLDHKIRIYRDGKQIWVEAKNIQKGDYVVTPKIQFTDNSTEYIDLNKYNVFGYDYDDKYIYEYVPQRNNYYRYSPAEISRNTKWGKSIIEKVANNNYKSGRKTGSLFEDILNYTHFKTIEEYQQYIKEKRTLKINRYIKNDYVFNTFIGLIYGDGFVCEGKRSIGLAINKTTKFEANRNVFYEIAKRLNVTVQENTSKFKNLIQLYINSNIMSNFVKTELFTSNRLTTKYFNKNLFNQNTTNLNGILNGLKLSDGSKETNRECFDNISLSLINAYKIIENINNNVCTLCMRKQHTDTRNYVNKDSYKLKIYDTTKEHSKKDAQIITNTNFNYLSINNIEFLEPFETDVYDIEVENSHSYLLYNMVVHNSAVSFMTNMLLGFTEVDRISAKVHMYPERFMSTTRILQSGSLADIDFNVAPVAPFAKAQQDVLGEDHAYPMIAYGTMQKSAAWKLYAKSQGIAFEIANAVSEQIKKYEIALKHAEEDEKDEINVLDFINKEYHTIYEKSKDYLGLVTSWSIAPCSYLLYQGSIRKDFGLVKVKDHICCTMDGHYAEACHFLKNDLLKVSVVDLIYKAYERIGMEPPSVSELLKMCPPDDSCWDIYAKGCTIGINQCEQTGTASRVAKYQPKNISELGAFVAAIRPGFKSMYKTFESRKPFSYGVKAFDDLIQTDEMPNSFLLYQEQEMAALNYAGIDMSDCYTAIKNIAKKRVDKVLAYKDKFIGGFSSVMVNDENKTPEEADQLSHQLWQIIEDSSKYSFNSSHSYCVALDSLYCAWLKAHYPLSFYEVYLTLQEEKGDKDKMNAAKIEAEDYFNIHFPALRFGQDNRKITADKNTNSITNSLSSIKGFGNDVGNTIYDCSQQGFKTFIEVLKYLDEHGIKSSKISPLIQIDYFKDFGNAKQLSYILEAWDLLKQGNRKIIKKDTLLPINLKEILVQNDSSSKNDSLSYKLDNAFGILFKYEKCILNNQIVDFDVKTKMKQSQDILGYINVITNNEEDRRRLLITDCNPVNGFNKDNIWAYRVGTKSIGTGKTARLTVKTDLFKTKPIKVGDIIFAHEVWKNPQNYWHLLQYDIEK